ncbi:metallophosphoesterase [Bradyrhizobium sp. SZCCHNR1093]|uniref:metallophosphoesterase family protein n=1 Tax=Bradyrhizobium sp. SZCCHNR1093 TaxID=3057368 RepID=UPI0028EFD675|nr:metallophosphoesterase [Bradyrhizobium sp. SZCCHNR1093]
MRTLIVADLHYSLPQFDWLVAAADHFDAVVFAGDALDLASIVDIRAQIVVVKTYLVLLAAKTRVMICSGNHDLEERSPDGEKIAAWIGTVRELGIAADGDDVLIGDTLFSLCPWWDGPLVKAAIGRQLDAAATRDAARWIWVHHAPPANSPVSWGGKRFFGDTELEGFIARHRPAMVISGHVHQSPFIKDGSWLDRVGETWVFNTGRQPGRPPAYMVLDTDEGRAFWLAAGQAEWVDLAGPLQRPAQPVTAAPDWLRVVDRIPDPFLAKPAAAAG